MHTHYSAEHVHVESASVNTGRWRLFKASTLQCTAQYCAVYSTVLWKDITIKLMAIRHKGHILQCLYSILTKQRLKLPSRVAARFLRSGFVAVSLVGM